MANCTVDDVLNEAMILLGDESGEVTQQIVTYFGMAYSELVSMLLKLNAQEATREVYFTLPAYTNVIFPTQLGVEDFAEPQQLWERGAVEEVDIVSVTDGTPVEVETVSPIVLASNNRVELNGVEGVPAWINRDWFVTVTGVNTFTLNGSYSTGFATTATGKVMSSQEQFIPMRTIDTRPPGGPGNAAVNQTLGNWRWEENALYFSGSTEPRQLWIEYLADATPPVVGDINLCQGREKQFLAYATAARFAMGARQMPVGPGLMLAAYGPTGEADGKGGLLRQLLAPIWRQQQQLPRRMGLMRPRRGFIAPVLG
jgi:hypothetical protein